MRLACFLALSLALVGSAVAQGRGSDSSEQGSALHAMGRVGSREGVQSGIRIPDYGGDVSAVRRLPIGTTPPRSRSFIRAPRRFLLRYW